MKTNTKYKEIFDNLPINDIIDMYINKKMGSSAIAKEFKCGSWHILEILKANNIPIYKYNNLPKDEINEMYNNGYSLEEIGRIYNIKAGDTIKRIIKNTSSKTDRINKEECISLYKEGKSLSRLASKYGVSYATIRTLLIKNNINLRTNRKGKNTGNPPFSKINSALFYIFDTLNNTKGLYGENELYIKKLGYWLDYFNEDLKLIIEYDENYHTYNLEEDKKREAIIKENFPEFKIIRITEEQLKEKIKNLLEQKLLEVL